MKTHITITIFFFLAGCGARAPSAERGLVGQIWVPAEQRFVTEAAALERMKRARFVLLGEKHDNAEHHRIQSRLVAALDRPVAFEMLQRRHAEALTTAKTPAAVAAATDWAHSGWPDFAIYEPVFAAALAHGPVVAAHPDRADLMALARDRSRWPEIDLPPPAAATLAEHIRVAHCGHANDQMVQMMTAAQRHKDQTMARSLSTLERGVLVAGNGHVRKDYGVPTLLEDVVAVGILEVRRGVTDPAAYDAPYDYVWFTERVDDKDPCEVFREQLEKMRSR